MIISRTPVRISFFGGGTDFRDFYTRSFGAVLSTAIKKYIYVAVNTKFDDNIRVSYSETENVDSLDKIKHDLVRECMRDCKIDKKVEIVTIADIPGHGSGLGSSSSLTVGLLNALDAYTNNQRSAAMLAKEACRIEIEVLKNPIGKQDQYIAAFGGFRYIKFFPDEKVSVEPIVLSDNTFEELKNNLISFYIPGLRASTEILSDQKKNISERIQVLEKMRDQAEEGRDLLKDGDISAFGSLLDQAWKLKSSLSSKISTSTINEYYATGLKAGAMGGKLSGAGGSGFLTFYCEKEWQKKLRDALSGLKEMDIDFEPEGTKILYSDH
jgi:D-glycero-alpha-D-manno-heptose-7-phosphate kinase